MLNAVLLAMMQASFETVSGWLCEQALVKPLLLHTSAGWPCQQLGQQDPATRLIAQAAAGALLVCAVATDALQSAVLTQAARCDRGLGAPATAACQNAAELVEYCAMPAHGPVE